jgi:hypothetical protein
LSRAGSVTGNPDGVGGNSTGQLHECGPPVGRFLQVIIRDPEPDVNVPGTTYTFTRLKHAQARGDLKTLRGHGLPAECVMLGVEPVAAFASSPT